MKAVAVSAVLLIVGVARAQSLFNAPQPAQPQPAQASPSESAKEQSTEQPKDNQPAPPPATPQLPAPTRGPNVNQMGMFVVTPMKPRDFAKHDKITILINEVSIQKFEQKMDSKRSYDLAAELKQFPSLEALIRNMTLADGIGSNTPNAGAAGSSNRKGEGTYERKDNMTAKLSGLVTEVKPNGLMLVECREVIQSDKETKTMIVSGLVDPKDVTNANTVISSQMANLMIKVEHAGELKEGTQKGLLPRLIDTLIGN